MNNQKKTNENIGKISIVGAGPGDPDLVTVKAVKCLEAADVVVYDYLAAKELLELAPVNAQKIYVGKIANNHSMKQEDINHLLVTLARRGKNVVRLKGGDPFVFGRGGEECETAKRAGVYYEVIPGVTAGIAGPAFAGIPLTQRNIASSAAFITGHEDPTKKKSRIQWKYLTKGVDTLVFYMGVANLEYIVKNLIKNGKTKTTPVAVIEWATTTRQRTVVGTLATIVAKVSSEKISSPAIIVVGKVVSLRKKIAWFEKLPLFGKTIINTRSCSQASVLSSKLRSLGAYVIEFPTIEICTIKKNVLLDSCIKKADTFDWLVLTSKNAAHVYFKRLLEIKKDVRSLFGTKIASIGSATTEAICSYHVTPEITATESTAEGLVQALYKKDTWKNKKVLIPCAKESRDVLPKELEKFGAKVTVLPVYETKKPRKVDCEVIDRIKNKEYDLITFTSSSTFTNFKALLGKKVWNNVQSSLQVSSIGPITSKTILDANIHPVVEAKEYNMNGLVHAICKHFFH